MRLKGSNCKTAAVEHYHDGAVVEEEQTNGAGAIGSPNILVPEKGR
jgi:hypothetical protein